MKLPVMNRSVKETTRIEKIVILIDSIFSQRQYSIGKTALRTIEKVLKNTANVRRSMKKVMNRVIQNIEELRKIIHY